MRARFAVIDVTDKVDGRGEHRGIVWLQGPAPGPASLGSHAERDAAGARGLCRPLGVRAAGTHHHPGLLERAGPQASSTRNPSRRRAQATHQCVVSPVRAGRPGVPARSATPRRPSCCKPPTRPPTPLPDPAPADNALAPQQGGQGGSSELNAFTFLKIATHFFKDFEFEPSKVDGFVDDIQAWSPWHDTRTLQHPDARNHRRGQALQAALRGAEPPGQLQPLYGDTALSVPEQQDRAFRPALRNSAREAFEAWLQDQTEPKLQ